MHRRREARAADLAALGAAGQRCVLETKRTPVFGSAIAETSGITRPGHGAFAVTPGAGLPRRAGR